MKVLVTGAAGFIGSFLLKELLTNGHEVIGLDNINDYYDVSLKHARLKNLGIDAAQLQYGKTIHASFQNHPFGFIQLNLEDDKGLDELFKTENFDAVVNMAAQAGVRYSIKNPKVYIQSNIGGFGNILEACRNFSIKHLVYASSSSVYGLNKKIPFSAHDGADHPVSLYAATKRSNELLAHAYSHLYNIPTTGLRFFTVYGPWGRPDMAYFLFADSIMKSMPVKIFNNGNMLRDFTYIDDIVQGISKVLMHPPKPNAEWDALTGNCSESSAPFKIYNIGNNKPVRLLDFIEILETALNKKAVKEMLPMQPGDVETTYADIDDLYKDFNYKPSTDITAGINKFVKWYLEYYPS